MHHLFIDVETGGRDPKIHGLLSIGAALFYPTSKIITNVYHSHVRPANDAAISLDALAVNGFTLQEMQLAPVEPTVYQQFSRWMAKYDIEAIWAHEAPFDEGFLRAWESRVGDWWKDNVPPNVPMTKVFEKHGSLHCSRQFLKLAKLRKHYPSDRSTSLKYASDYFGIPPSNHSAMLDARNGAMLVQNLYSKFGWGATTNGTI